MPGPPVSEQWQSALTVYEAEALSRGYSPRTIDNRRSAITGLARFLSVESPDEVTSEMLQRAMIRAHKERARSGPRTYFNDLRSFWVWWADDTGKPNPMDGMKRPRDQVVPVRVLTPKEIAAVRASMSGRDFYSVRDNAIFLTLLESGIRRSELCATNLADLDVKGRELVIRKGKNRTARVVVLGPVSAAALARLWRMHPGGEPLYTSKGGRRLTESAVGAMLRKRGKLAGLPDLRAHMLRHTWAHYSLASGLGEHDIMVLGGWSSTTQLGRYGAAQAQARALAAGKSKPVLELVQGRAR